MTRRRLFAAIAAVFAGRKAAQLAPALPPDGLAIRFVTAYDAGSLQAQMDAFMYSPVRIVREDGSVSLVALGRTKIGDTIIIRKPQRFVA